LTKIAVLKIYYEEIAEDEEEAVTGNIETLQTKTFVLR
jgi:hypothetical protein